MNSLKPTNHSPTPNNPFPFYPESNNSVANRKSNGARGSLPGKSGLSSLNQTNDSGWS